MSKRPAQTCGSCRWCQPVPPAAPGPECHECHRFPPTVVNTHVGTAIWPRVRLEDHCGEHARARRATTQPPAP